jgi:hypothetical protein
MAHLEQKMSKLLAQLFQIHLTTSAQLLHQTSFLSTPKRVSKRTFTPFISSSDIFSPNQRPTRLLDRFYCVIYCQNWLT